MKIITRKIFILLFVIFLTCEGWFNVHIAQAKLNNAKKKEYEIKAAFIYHFLKFIDRSSKEPVKPDSEKETLVTPKKKLVIGFVADKEIFEACKAIHGKRVKDKVIQAVLFNQLSEKDIKAGNKSKTIKALKRCDVLFVCMSQQTKSARANFRSILTTLKGLNILTIGEMKGFIECVKRKEPCGIINFIIEDNKVRFEINLDMAHKSGFQVRAQLLKLSKRVIKKEKTI